MESIFLGSLGGGGLAHIYEKSVKEENLDKAVLEEAQKRNQNYRKRKNRPFHPSWLVRIRSELKERHLLRKGWQGTRIKFTELGGHGKFQENYAIISEVVAHNGKAVTTRRLVTAETFLAKKEEKQQQQHGNNMPRKDVGKQNKMKRAAGWCGTKIKFT